ncbi:MAG: N(G),N(G)-dimethylarginine dimethylaminohydrolase [Atopobiaceae bacterium]|nr:N(G),N(G)-dimethylarginine dimethylaminohydrolase [Atopobiaceae bacterium]
MAQRFTHAIARKPATSIARGLSRYFQEGKPDYELACEQHAAYVEALKTAGLEVMVLPPLEEYPDSIFVEDTCIVTPQGVVLDRPGAKTRFHEPEFVVAALREFFSDEDMVRISEPGTLEGGDVMFADNHFFVGKSTRTNDDGFRQFAEAVGRWGYTAEQVPVEQTLHLKTGSTYMDDGHLLVSGEFCNWEPFFNKKRFSETYCVPQEETYAACCLHLNDVVLMSAGYPAVRAQLEAWGLNVIELEMSEFRKIDGSITCLSLRW